MYTLNQIQTMDDGYCCNICGRTRRKLIKAHGKLWCDKHYKQQNKYGHPLDTSPRTIYDKNEIRVNGAYAEMDIYDKNGKVVATTIIDTQDVNKVRDTKWKLSHGYVMSSHRFSGAVNQLHRVIMNVSATQNVFVDHINHDTLDNRKANLRLVSKSQNAMNSEKQKGRTLPHGITVCKNGRFYAHIKINQKMLNLGTYDDCEEAKFARWYAETLLFKDYQFKKEKPFVLLRREQEIVEYVDKKVQRL